MTGASGRLQPNGELSAHFADVYAPSPSVLFPCYLRHRAGSVPLHGFKACVVETVSRAPRAVSPTTPATMAYRFRKEKAMREARGPRWPCRRARPLRALGR
jgi:hypothetical protein